MRTQIRSQKSQNKLLFCTLCGFIASNESELQHHYVLAHEEDNDISTELEITFESKKSKENKPKTLKGKAIEQLKLLTFGKIAHNEYIGSCEVPYYLTTEKENGITKIVLEQGMWIC